MGEYETTQIVGTATDRAIELMQQGDDFHSACVNAAHHHNCSAELVKAAVTARGQGPDPYADDEIEPCRQHKDTGRGTCCYCGAFL